MRLCVRFSRRRRRRPDSERNSEADTLGSVRLAFKEACDKLGIPCHVLERRAIDNYLTDRAVRRVLGESYRGLSPFERLGDVTPHWPKGQNARIAAYMEAAEVESTDLGAFLSEQFRTS